jgi:hypothetical protein
MQRRYLLTLAVAFMATPLIHPLLSTAQTAPRIPRYQPQSPDEVAILQLAQARDPKIEIYILVQVEQYALYSWTLGETGGQALVKKDKQTQRWQFVRGTGGALTVANLVKFGAPQIIAQRLVKQHKQQVQKLKRN